MKYRVVINTKTISRVKRLGIMGLWVFGGGALVGIAFLASFYTAMRVEMRSTQVEVPDLVGLTMDAARQSSVPSNLVLEVVDQRNDPRVPSGRVLEQMPPPGAEVRRGRKVKLILSLGGKVLQVPDIAGHASRAAVIELRQEGFVPGDEAHIYSLVVPAGRVVAQVPEADTTAVPHSRVHRLVSDGIPPRLWVMPDLIGRNRIEAERWIALSGFRKGTVRRVPAPGKRRGTVVAQIPLAGFPVRSRAIVELAVAD